MVSGLSLPDYLSKYGALARKIQGTQRCDKSYIDHACANGVPTHHENYAENASFDSLALTADD